MARITATLLLTLSLGVMAAQGQNPAIVGYEYWFDQNDADRTYVAVTPSQIVNLSDVPLNTAALQPGPHIAHLRLKDNQSNTVRWSTVVSRGLVKGLPGPWEITAVRYWIGSPVNDQDPVVRYRYFDTAQTDISYDGVLDLCGYSTGVQTLKLQLRDNHGQWSSVVTRTVSVQPAGTLGTPVITASVPSFCPGDMVVFTATPPTGPDYATPSGYTWSVPSGNGWSHTPSTGNTITVVVGNTGGTVQVHSNNYCGSSTAASFAANIPAVPAQPTAIGPTAACAGSEVVFAVASQQGITYEWMVNGGQAVLDDATYSTILSDAATITVTPVNICGVSGPPQTATITVAQPADAGIDSAIILCEDAAPTSLFAQLGGTPDAGGAWSGPSTVVGDVYDPAIMDSGSYTYTVTGTAPCPNEEATIMVTETVLATWYIDADGDGFGNGDSVLMACDSTNGYVSNAGDCDDDDTNLTAPGMACDDDDSTTVNDTVTDTCTCVGELPTGLNGTTPTSAWFTLHPNPSTGTFQLVSAHSGNMDLLVYDALGQLVAIPTALTGTQPRALHLEHLPDGLYFLRASRAGGTRTTRLVIAR